MPFDRTTLAGGTSVTIGEHYYDQLAIKGGQGYLISPAGNLTVFDLPENMDISPGGLKDFLKNDAAAMFDDPDVPRIHFNLPDDMPVDDFAQNFADKLSASGDFDDAAARAYIQTGNSWGDTAERLIGNGVEPDIAIRAAVLKEAVQQGTERRAAGDHRIPEMNAADITENAYRRPEYVAELIQEQNGGHFSAKEFPRYDDVLKDIKVEVHGSSALIDAARQSAPDLEAGTERGRMAGQAAEFFESLGKRAGLVGGAVFGTFAATAAGAAEYEQDGSAADIARAAADAAEDTVNPYAETSEAVYNGAESNEVANTLTVETAAIGGELSGGALGVVFGGAAGTAIAPGVGTTIGAIVGGVGGAIVGADTMRGIAEDYLAPGEIPDYQLYGGSPGAELFNAYYDAQQRIDVDAPGSAAAITEAFDKMAHAEKIYDHIRSDHVGTLADAEALVAAHENGEAFTPSAPSIPDLSARSDAEARLEAAQENYMQVFEAMDIQDLEGHVDAIKEAATSQLEEAGLTGDVALPDGRVMDMTEALGDRDSFETLYRHFQDTENPQALEAMQDYMVAGQLEAGYQKVENIYEAMQPETAIAAAPENTNTADYDHDRAGGATVAAPTPV